MHHPALTLFTLSTLLLTIFASPLHVRSTRTTTCLSDTFGGCCVVDAYGIYGSCTNASLVAENVPWTGMPTTLKANQWACNSPDDGQGLNVGCCEWNWNTVCDSLC